MGWFQNENKSDKLKRKRGRGNHDDNWSATSIAKALTAAIVLVILLGVLQLNQVMQHMAEQKNVLPVLPGNYAAEIQHMVHDEDSNSNSNNNDKQPNNRINHGDHKFIIFHKIEDTQGAGNVMHGLLAAHLLGDEFQRTVCISNSYESFHFAFEAIHPMAVQHCPDILERHNKNPPDTPREQTIELLNYRTTPVNECKLKEMLASHKRVLHMTANTYPRWPHIPKHIHFFAFYKAKPILLEILPYPTTEPPPIVIHLRHPDVEGVDSRKGVAEQDLRALGQNFLSEMSQNAKMTPWLVTNNVEWFNYFRDNFGWSHPFWNVVMHSEYGLQWDERQRTESPLSMSQDRRMRLAKYQQVRQQIGVDKFEWLQLWCDYYTLLRAEKVYHTFSDFSLSAVHWQGIWSRTYDGLDEWGKLKLLEENWITDGESPRLIDRGDKDLRFCLHL